MSVIDIVAFGVGFKCPRKIHLNTVCPPPMKIYKLPTALLKVECPKQMGYGRMLV